MSLVARIQTSIGSSLRAVFDGVSHSSTRSFQTLMKPLASGGVTTQLAMNSVVTSALPGVAVTSAQKLLTPCNNLVAQVAGFKIKGRIKRRCKDCYIVIRQQRQYVICPTHPRHKQMGMKPKPSSTWILTHATQSKERGY